MLISDFHLHQYTMIHIKINYLLLRMCLFLSGMAIFEKGFGQNTTFPYSGETVKLDSLGKADKGLPFDRTFYLERDKINTEGILAVEVYRVKYNNGKRQLYPDPGTRNVFTADYIFKASDIIREKNKLTLIMPALKPNKDFDILVFRGATGENYKMAAKLNEMLIKGPLVWGVDAAGAPAINPGSEMRDLYKKLRKTANTENYDPVREVFPETLTKYYTVVVHSVLSSYNNATNQVNLRIKPFLTSTDTKNINDGLDLLHKKFHDIYLLEKINYENTFTDILYGYRAANASILSTKKDPFELNSRVTNLNISIQYFDSLFASLNELVIYDASVFNSIRQTIKDIVQVLEYNRKYLDDNLKAINKNIAENATEAVWLTGNTQSKDLQTRGASIFTLDLGISNIWARDLDNESAYIPKLYYGVNIYFRPVDKNGKFKYLPRKKNRPANEDYDILSKRTIFQRLSLTAGFTIGSLDKVNFDNFFGGSSLLLGPGFRVTRAFRLSTGVCFLKRSQANPLLSDKKFTSGYYASLSLDIDLLGTINKATSIFFK